MRNLAASSLIFALLALGPGCSGESPASPSASVADRLTLGSRLQITHANSVAMLTARAQPLGEVRVAVGVVGGQVDLTLMDGALHLGQFELGLDEATLAPGGLQLRVSGATLRLDGTAVAAATVSADGDRVSAQLVVALTLEGTVSLGSLQVPLGLQQLMVPLHVEVTHDEAGHLSAGLTATVSGTFWDWAGVARMADLSLMLRATD
ncbi:MAG: hypothetical protein IT370_18860 [Deltaproteobacteria bacterium]|nr:hypothetical protein [Deltaproteobacteria bacterium]